jgi:hypothetical protein
MKKGKCPKCGSHNVYFKHYKMAEVLGNIGGSPGEKDEYVCTECGFHEEYMIDKAALKAVQEKWTKAG